MGNISKKAGGPIRADEVGWDGRIKDSKKDADADALADAIGLGVSKPVPVAFPWTIYTVTSTEDDDKPGIYCLTVFDVPKDTMGLKIKYCYVKADGSYGRVKWFPSYRLDDAERTAGRVEVQFGPLRPNSRIDIVRAVAVKRAAKDVGNPPLGDDDRRGKGTTPAYTPPTLPVDPSGAWGDYSIPYANQIPGDSNPLTMGTILTGEYITGSPRILDVDPPKKEVDGVYYPVKIATTENVEDLMVSVRFGVYRVGTKAGGANTYSRRIPTPRHELTEEEREELSTNGFVWVDVGPLKANKKYHIKWIRARYSLDPDDSGAKVVRHRHPLPVFSGDVDLTQDYLPQDIVDGQTPGVQHSRDNVTGVDPLGALIDPVPGGDADDPPLTDPAGFLAVLAPTGDITDPPSDPNASDIITNEPDDATEKDKDAIIVLRVWAAEGNRAKYLIDPNDATMVTWSEANVNRVAVVIKTLLKDGVTYKQRRHAEDIEDPDAVFVDIQFHRRINKDLVWVKNVSLNEADREFSSTVNLAFVAGDTGSIADIASLTLSITQDGDDNRQALATLTIANGTVSGNAAVPKRVVIMRGKYENDNTGAPTTLAEINDGNAKWRPVFKKNLRADSDVLADVGTHTLTYTVPGVTSAKGIRYYRAFLFVVGDDTWVTDDDDNIGGMDDGVMDSVVPPAPATAPTIRFRHGHLRAKIARPDASIDGNRLIYKWEWQFCSHSSFTGNSTRTFLQDNDTTPIIASLVGAEPEIESSGVKLSIPIKRKDFTDMWEAGTSNIYCRVRPYNHIGTSTSWSPTLTHAIGLRGASLDDVEDIAVPATVAAPTARYKDGTLRFKCVKPASGINTLDYYEWQISNDPAFSTGAGIYYIQDNDTTLVTASSSTIQSENRKLVVPATRTDLALLVPVSGSTARRPVLNFRVRGHNRSGVDDGNGAGNAVWSSAGTLTLGRADGDVNRHGATGRINMIDGGGFMSSRWNSDSSDPTDQPFKMWKYRVVTGMSGPAYRIENTRSGTASGTNSSGTPDSGLSAVIWDSTNHQLDFGYRGTGSTLIYCNAATKVRRQFVAGEVYTLTFDLKSATANFDPGTLIVAITNDNGSSAGLASQSLTFSNADASSANPKLGTSYRPYKVTFTLSGSPTGSAWIYFSFSNSGWSSGQHVYLDNVCLVRGNQAMLFEASAADIAIDESPLVTNFANGTESIGDAGGNGDDGIGNWGYMDV